MIDTLRLHEIPDLEVRAERRLARYTTYGIGGPAGALAEPTTMAAFTTAWRRAARQGVPARVLGGGSNLLVADAGFPGLVLRTRQLRALASDPADDTLVHAQAGVGLARLVRWCADRGLAGTEVLAGIPGSVGGAIAMNAGGRHGEIADLCELVVTAAPDGRIRRRHPVELGFGYRTARLHGEAVLGVILRGSRTSVAEARGRVRAILHEKGLTQPLRARSAGCVFTNPAIPAADSGHAPTPRSAGWLIDRAGCKGMRVGGIEVSPRHANFFVNVGGGTASDVLRLAARVRGRVYERFGIVLTPEMRLWSEQTAHESPFVAA